MNIRPTLIAHSKELLEAYADVADRTPADKLISEYFRGRRYLGSHDRRFLAESFYGILRHRRLLAEAMNACGIEATPNNLLAAYYIIVEENGQDVALAAGLAERKVEKLKAFRSGVSSQPLGVKYSFPDWLVERLKGSVGEKEIETLLSTINTPAPLVIRVNLLKGSREDCAGMLLKEGVETIPTKLSPWGLTLTKRFNVFGLKAFKDGWFEMQDEASQLVVHEMNLKPTIKVLDLCAGAGGKTLAMAGAMGGRGEIFATDFHEWKLEELRRRAKRADAQNIRAVPMEKIAGMKFDVVLIDAPCTGTGTLRRNPGMKWTISETMLSEVKHIQHKLLRSATEYVKEGGALVYVTCSLFREENEEQIENFLIENSSLSVENEKKWLPHVHNTDGFFMGRIMGCGVLHA